eukprot:Skav217983  [mRNA]  locus=scaffold496:462182:469147:- [translate_table: standard]
MRVTLLLCAVSSAHASADWMGRHFQLLRHKTLLQLTLPGSHNSGNYQGGLHADLLCESDYRYDEYLASPSSRKLEASGRPVLSRTDHIWHCSSGMIPWNVNHFQPIKTQLREDGVRFLHLKICNFGVPGAATMDLAAVRFQHRGYTTRETVASTIQDLRDFLEEHPKEIVLLGFNNLHNSGSTSFGPADVAALSMALERAIGSGNPFLGKPSVVSMPSAVSTTGGSCSLLFEVFVKDAPPGSHIIPSQLVLDEGWSPVMASGDLTGSQEWLLKDLQTSSQGRFNVMQANPNNAENKMYEAMNTNAVPATNLDFLRSFLQDLQGLVLHAVRANPKIQINVIDSDFLSISKPYATAMQLMGLPRGLQSEADDGSIMWLKITALCGLCGCLICRWRLRQKSDYISADS